VTRLEALALASIGKLVLVLALVTPVSIKISRASSGVTSTAIDSHALATAVTSTTSAPSRLGRWNIEVCLRGGFVFVFGTGCGRELEAGRGSFLLGEFGGLLGIGES
jgi:hypothetical protein